MNLSELIFNRTLGSLKPEKAWHSRTLSMFAVFISSVQLIYKLCSQCWMQVHVSSCKSANTTRSRQHYATIYTGCLFVSEYCTSCTKLFTSVFSCILSDESECSSRYQYKSSLSSLSNTWRLVGAQDENGDLWTTKFCRFWSYYLEYFAIDPTCIGHYNWTVSEWTKDNTVSFGL